MKPLRHAMTAAIGVALAVGLLAIAGAGDAAMAKPPKKDTAAKAPSSPGYMGIYMQDLDEDVRAGLDLKGVSKGVLVSGVEEDGPADKAGLQEGDVVVSFNGDAVTTPDELRSKVRAAEAGSKAKLGIVRDGKKQTIEVTLGEREDFRYSFRHMVREPDIAHAFAMMGGPRLGIRAYEFEGDDMASYFGVKPGTGVLVLGVDEGSVADKAGLKPGDVVQTIGGEKVSSVEDIRDACHDMDEGDEFAIGVLRHGKNQELKATMDEARPSWAFNDEDGDWRGWRHAPRALVLPHDSRDELRRELDQLKKELKELKQELENHDG
jgi:serine protease Do